MRPIKFRAWSIKEKTMFTPEALWFEKEGVWLNNSHDYGEDKYRNKLFGWSNKDIILMQFTGLKDKNGKEIFEGDIFKDRWGELSIIQWDKGHAGFEATKTHMTLQDMLNGEVIGNIHENQELLK